MTTAAPRVVSLAVYVASQAAARTLEGGSSGLAGPWSHC